MQDPTPHESSCTARWRASTHPLLGMLAALALGGCTVNVLSPPVGPALPTSSKPLTRGEHAVSGDAYFGGHFDGQASLRGGRVAYRGGVGQGAEVTAEGHTLRFIGETNGTSPWLGSGRVGLRWAPVDYFALHGGLGGGHHGAGGYVVEDIGFVTAAENPYLVPFFSFGFFASQPRNAREVELWESGVLGEGDLVADTPTPSWGFLYTAGLRIPLKPQQPDARLMPSALFSLQAVHLRDADGGALWGVVNVGFELRFRTRNQLRIDERYATGRQ